MSIRLVKQITKIYWMGYFTVLRNYDYWYICIYFYTFCWRARTSLRHTLPLPFFFFFFPSLFLFLFWVLEVIRSTSVLSTVSLKISISLMIVPHPYVQAFENTREQSLRLPFLLGRYNFKGIYEINQIVLMAISWGTNLPLLHMWIWPHVLCGCESALWANLPASLCALGDDHVLLGSVSLYSASASVFHLSQTDVMFMFGLSSSTREAECI